MKKIIIAAIALLSCLTMHAQQKFVPVFVSGTDGYKSFRIPAIVSLPNGSLLAFCEGRVNGSGDYGNIDIVMKRSIDKGKTWSALQVVADYGNLQLCNPAPVVDLSDPLYPKGRIFLFYNTGNNHEGEILNGKGIKYCMYKTSVDGGNTWSDPVDITEQVHRPNQPSVNPIYNFKEDWRYYANTPGHAMQFQSGKYKGRIFVAANHSAGNPQKGAGHYVAHGYYSDDHGKTFKLGNSLNLPGSNESMAVELSGSRLMMNSRNQRGDVRARIVSISSDGGASWDSTYFDHKLIDPVCQGSILNVGEKKGKNILAFCNAADVKERNNLTLRISFDEGNTWTKSIPVYKGQSNSGQGSDFSAYSDLVTLSQKHVGILFEKDGYSQIVFTEVKWR
ncbi:sialidase family protein [Bacteroides sedimenti]|uniref:exo-alpha-sialidase n=1 Tax=Bacteroides sedimenti TaxID=2136147 RepID=A0ABM8IB29_9BACE